MNEYRKQVIKFLDKTNSNLSFKLIGISDRFNSGNKTFEYNFILKKGNRQMIGKYNSSLNDLYNVLKFREKKINPKSLLASKMIKSFEHQLNTGNDVVHISCEGRNLKIYRKHIPKPSDCELLTCLQSREVNEDIQEFANEYGYEIKNVASYRRLEEIHKSCLSEYKDLTYLYSDSEMEELQKII